MIKVDEEALICDLAETYHIYDYRSLPVKLVATLSCGLREDSRIKLKLNGEPAPINTILLARLADLFTAMLYTDNTPPSIVERLYGVESEEKEDKVITFDSGEEFFSAWSAFTQEGNI